MNPHELLPEDQFFCQYCEEKMSFHKTYVCTLEPNPDWEKSLRAYGHKYCLMSLERYYKKYGRIVTAKEAELLRFDASI